MSEYTPIVEDALRVHGTLHQHELIDLHEHWAKLDHRLQSFKDGAIDIDLHINDRDTPSQHVTLGVHVGGLHKDFVASSSSSDLGRALNEVRDEMIRQLSDAKNRTEPRNNKHLRDTARRGR
jgi:ribosome-associated translation inhibitor RaiA